MGREEGPWEKSSCPQLAPGDRAIVSQQPASCQVHTVRPHRTHLLFPVDWEESGLQSGGSTWTLGELSVLFTHLTVPQGEAENRASTGSLRVVPGPPRIESLKTEQQETVTREGRR